ncbi:hypothetical protein IFM89_019602, partial [Coptis chinensis]
MLEENVQKLITSTECVLGLPTFGLEEGAYTRILPTSLQLHYSKQKDPHKIHQVKSDVIVKALRWLGMDMDVDRPSLHGTGMNQLRSQAIHSSQQLTLPVIANESLEPFPRTLNNDLSYHPQMAGERSELERKRRVLVDR